MKKQLLSVVMLAMLASAASIKSAILNSVISTPSLAGKCVTGGRLNVSGF